MKRVFSGIISQFTQAISKIFGGRKSKESIKETKGLSSGDKSVEGDAKGVSGLELGYVKNYFWKMDFPIYCTATILMLLLISEILKILRLHNLL